MRRWIDGGWWFLIESYWIDWFLSLPFEWTRGYAVGIGAGLLVGAYSYQETDS